MKGLPCLYPSPLKVQPPLPSPVGPWRSRRSVDVASDYPTWKFTWFSYFLHFYENYFQSFDKFSDFFLQINHLKELSFGLISKCSNPHIFSTCWCKALIFQTLINWSNTLILQTLINWSNRVCSLKYHRSTTLGCKDFSKLELEA